LELPRDDTLGVPTTRLGGELTYNYDKGSYLTNNLVFDYGTSRDRVQGTILWEKDLAEYLREGTAPRKLEKDEKGWAKDGKSQYVFTLGFAPWAEAKGGAGKLFAGEEKDLMRTSSSSSTLTGTVSYLDTGPIKEEDGERYVLPHQSKVTFDLHANR